MNHVQQVAKNILTNVTNGFEKGELENTFGYNDTVKIRKSGKDIKDNLFNVIQKKMMTKEELSTQIKYMKTFLNCIPTDAIEDFRYRDYKEQIQGMCDCIDKVFPYSMGVAYREDMDSKYSAFSNPNSIDKTTCEMFEKYNNLVFSCLDVCVEICLANTILNNIDENADYMLNVKQLNSLGF